MRVGGPLGDGAGDPQPRAVEYAAPCGAVAQRAERAAIELGEGDRLARAHDLGPQRRQRAVDAPADAAQAGGLTGLALESYLFRKTGSHALGLSILVAGLLPAVIALLFLPETSQRSLEEIAGEE